MRLAPPVLLLLSLAPALSAQVELFQDFDSGSLDVAGSSIDLSAPAEPLVTLEPRRFAGAWGGNHWWVSFEIRGVAGRTPRFRMPTSGAFQGFSNANRWVYSATPDDPASWAFFDSGVVSGGFYRFSNAGPFADDVVRVAIALPYPYSRTVQHTASLIGDPFVAPTASASASLVLGSTAGTAGGGYVDDLGRSVPARELFGYRVTDPAASGPKWKVVLTTGNHSGETTGTWTLQGFVDFVLSADPAAAELREKAEVFVYPQSDPEGRASGYFRSNPENPPLNHNRWWDATAGFTDLALLTAAIRADTGGDADVFLDFHSFGSGTGIGYYQHTANAGTTALLARLTLLEPALFSLGSGVFTPGWAAEWAKSPAGLSADIAFTPESGFLAGEPVDRYAALGESWARAVLHAIDARGPATRPRPRSELAFLSRTRQLPRRMHLRLNERAPSTGRIAHDDSGAGNAGAYAGGVALERPDPFSLGRGSAARFDGVDDHVRVPDFGYAGPAGDFTLAFWFRTADVSGPGLQYLFSHGAVATPQSLNVYFVEEGHSSGIGPLLRTVYKDADDPSGYVELLDSPAFLSDGEWHLYALVYSSAMGPTGAAILYVDGVEHVRNAAIGGGAYDPPTDVFLAAREDLDPDRFWGAPGAEDGLLDEVLLVERALEEAELAELFASKVRTRPVAGPPRPTEGPALPLLTASPSPEERSVHLVLEGAPPSASVVFFLGRDPGGSPLAASGSTWTGTRTDASGAAFARLPAPGSPVGDGQLRALAWIAGGCGELVFAGSVAVPEP